MSGKPRHVIMRVDDPDVTDVVVWPVITLDEDDRLFRDPVEVPVPPDGQMVRDVERLTEGVIDRRGGVTSEWLKSMGLHEGAEKEVAAEARADVHAARRLRAAFGLDEGRGT